MGTGTSWRIIATLVLMLVWPIGATVAAEARRLAIPLPDLGIAMQADFYMPADKGPFRLAVVNHGSNEDGRLRARMQFPRYTALTEWLLVRGYAVLVPLRPGHGETGGPYLESQGSCAHPDYVGAGQRTATAILAAVRFGETLDGVRRTGAVVIGNSAGGWGAIALADQSPKVIAAIVNVAGGRGGRNHDRPNNNCDADGLVRAAAEFGARGRLPSLWLYAENDTSFGPDLSRRLADAYTAAGGVVEFHLLPPVGTEGHALMLSPPEAGWGEPLAAFLKYYAK